MAKNTFEGRGILLPTGGAAAVCQKRWSFGKEGGGFPKDVRGERGGRGWDADQRTNFHADTALREKRSKVWLSSAFQ